MKRYSYQTTKSYKSAFRDFISYYPTKKPEDISKAEVESYILHCIKTRHYSESTQNLIINAIKFYYEKVLCKPRAYYDIDRPQKANKLPHVPSTFKGTGSD